MASESKYVTLDPQNFQAEVLDSPLPVLVDFWAAWCGPCRSIAPAIEALAAEFEGRVKVGKVDVDEHPELATEYGVQGIPTLLVFRGGRVVDQVVGAVPKQVLADKLLRAAGDGVGARREA